MIRAQRLGRRLEKPAAVTEDAPDPMELTDDDLTDATPDDPTPTDALTYASRGRDVESLPDLGASPLRAPTLAPAPAARPAFSAFGRTLPRVPVNPIARPAPAPPALSRPAPTAEDAQLRTLHERFVEARRMTGESTDVQYESIARQARETLPRLALKYQGAEVRLDVSIKDGKAVLKPIVTMPKKA